MENFTPVSAIIGGLLIGLSATLLLWLNGRIAGISGIFFGTLESAKGDRAWRWWFIVGLLLGAGLYFWLRELAFTPAFAPRTDFPMGLLILAGFLVGIGTRLGSGCTSGHGVCGLARLSARSLTATVIFITSAIVTTFVVKHLLGVSL